MEHLLLRSKCSFFHNTCILKNLTFQRHPKALNVWSKGLSCLTCINDMPESNVHLFADDSLFYTLIHMPEDSKHLQLDLLALERWEKEWVMSFNASKCRVIRITLKSRKTKETNCILHGQTLAVEESSKYMHVTVTNHLSRNIHVETVTAKRNITLGFIKRNLRNVPKQSKQPASPILEYVSTPQCGIPPPSNIQTLEQIQMRAARFVMNDYTTRSPGCVTHMQEDLGWDLPQNRQRDSRLSMFFVFFVIQD